MSQERHSALGIHTLDTGDADLLKRRQIVRRAKIISVVVLILLAAGAGRTVMSRISNARALAAGTEELARQYVKLTHVKTDQGGQTLLLPGTLLGYVQAPISARASGYLRKWHKDKELKELLNKEADTPAAPAVPPLDGLNPDV